MDQIQILDAIERYLDGRMSPDERYAFEHLRKTNPDVDQLVVEHTTFLQQLDKYGSHKQIKSTLQEVHTDLAVNGTIDQKRRPAGIVFLWKKHKKVMAVAASIAGITTLLIAGMVNYYSRKVSSEQLQQLSKKFENTERKVNALKMQVESGKENAKAPSNAPIKSGGTGFLIDGKGLLVTNAHVVEGSNTVVVQNNHGDAFRARILHVNNLSDIAVLQIEDADYKPISSLPYGLKKSGADLGESLFTLGYPREEIVYNEGYMSAKTGFNGDTLTCQIGVPANPGNSGGPVFNKNGEVVAIINTRQALAEGVVFAINAKNIFITVDSLMNTGDTTLAANFRLPVNSTLKGMERVQQVRKITDCIYMVKSY